MALRPHTVDYRASVSFAESIGNSKKKVKGVVGKCFAIKGIFLLPLPLTWRIMSKETGRSNNEMNSDQEV
jgi:hypothetical protein